MQNLVTALIVMVLLWILKRRTEKREEKMSEGKFLIKLSSGYFFLGAIEAGMMAVIMFWGGGGLPRELLIIGILTAMPGIFLMIFPLSGVWEIFVDCDAITVTKCFVLKKHFQFGDISYCKTARGGMKVYIKERRRKAFFVDAMMDGAGLFFDKIKHAKIPVDGKVQETQKFRSFTNQGRKKQ